MLRELRVPMLLLRAAAALFRQGVDLVLYGYLAVAWAHSLGGIAVEILGRWTYGKGSAAENIGSAVRASCWFIMVRFFLAFAPLFLMRLIEHAKFQNEEEEKERRGKLARNDQLPKRDREQILLPKGFMLVPLFMSGHLCQLRCLALLMQHHEEQGSRLWSVGSVLHDVACFGLALNMGFLLQNMAIIMTVPKVQERNDIMQ